MNASMATRVITETDCDRCEKKNVPVKTISLQTGWEPDPAGGASQRTGIEFDLCIECMAEILRADLKNTPHKEVAAMVKDMKVKHTRDW